ncbi:MAG: hypothetical protein QM811_04470 [Pirellulales bacterium]
MKLRYEFPPDKVQRGIRWLELEAADGGVFVYQFEDIDAPCKWDNFYADLEDALSDWEAVGVSRSDWYEVE